MPMRADQPQRGDAPEQLRAFVWSGEYAPGDRLPPERRLIEILGISRPALRRALEQSNATG